VAEVTQENDNRKKTEAAMRSSEERWRKLFDNSAAGIHLSGNSGEVQPDAFCQPLRNRSSSAMLRRRSHRCGLHGNALQ